MALYTPFFERNTAKVADMMGQRRSGELAQSAYMGDPQALSELYRVNPRLAGEVKNQKMREEQFELNKQAMAKEAERADQEWALQHRQLIQQVMQRAAAMPDYENARNYIAGEIQGLRESGVQVPERFGAETFTPEAFQQIKQAFPAPRQDLMNVDEGNAVFDPNTRKQVFVNPKGENYNQPFLSDGTPNPAYQEYQERLRAAGRPETTINMPSPVDKATEKFGEGIGNRVNARIEQATNAQSQNTQLQRMSEALESGANTGTGQATLLTLKNLGQSLFGLELPETAGEQEVVQALSNRLALEIRNPTSGLGLPGATSNRDLSFLMESVPGLQRTPEGNALLIDYFMRINDMKRDVAQEQQRIIDENNGLVPNNIDTRLMNFINKYEILTDSDKTALKKVSESGDGLTPEEQRELEQLRRELGVGR